MSRRTERSRARSTGPAAGAPDDERAGRSRRPLWHRVLRGTLVALALYLAIGNGMILSASLWARWHNDPSEASRPSSVTNFRKVDDRVWRGAAPGAAALSELAAMGVTTVVDLRAELGPDTDDGRFGELDLGHVHLPVRDGQLPTAEQTARFGDIVARSDGVVFVHCGAGVGRAGAMAAHYLTSTDQASGPETLRRNLAVGPPSLEQIVFAAGADDSGYDRPGVVVTGLSRVLDAPRRIWHNVT